MKAWFLKHWDKLATYLACGLVGAALGSILPEMDASAIGAIAGVAGRLLAHVEVRL